MNELSALTGDIKRFVLSNGFDLCGIARVRPLTERAEVIKRWCEAGMNDCMGYLSRNQDKRTDPSLLMPGAKSVLVTGLSYNSPRMQTAGDVPVISRYAYGENYHDVITRKLEVVLQYIKSLLPDLKGEIFVDSEPLLEKAWAVEAGLGWQGKHSVVINEKTGSFFFIGILLLSEALEFDKPVSKSKCGNCTICIDSCPTAAINSDGTIDARRCIANLTIERRGPVPEDLVPLLGNSIYGCDICQEVCPWNKKAPYHHTAEFQISEELRSMTTEQWMNLTNEDFIRLFKNTPVERRKYEPLMMSIGYFAVNHKKKS